jgi:hypothetical protein
MLSSAVVDLNGSEGWRADGALMLADGGFAPEAASLSPKI